MAPLPSEYHAPASPWNRGAKKPYPSLSTLPAPLSPYVWLGFPLHPQRVCIHPQVGAEWWQDIGSISNVSNKELISPT